MLKFEKWLETMFLFCSSEVYDLDSLKSYVSKGGQPQREFKRKYEEVLAARPFSAKDWEKEMNFSHENDADLYDFLSALYEFLFRNGPYPDWD
jgi:hypothetical protein